ncbi:hapless 8 [Zea mays]|nr:hapless 8 [Zea mays]ONM16781.1 hapless 8 [Zea mays]
MASKTCPVCKVFASTSNTTLNAHIDQCLSVESNTELVETVLVKPKVKPRKKRLMVDIYKTALPYTLEDLDRRNCTNWAVELAMSPVSKEVCTENGSPEVVSFDRRDDEREGDVYVDSNGIKIRILSKCNDVPLVLKDDLGSSKVAKHGTGKGILMSKKMLKSKLLKNKKLKMHGKKYNKTSHLNSQVQADPHDDINEETSEEERNAWNPSESTSNCGSRTMQQWVCSKRSDINKKLSKNHSGKTFDKVAPGAQKSDRSSMFGFNDSQVPESPVGVFSSESLYMATTSEATGVEQSNGPSKVLRSIPTWSSKTHLQSSVIPKVPRSAAALAKRKIKEIGRREATKLDNYDVVRNPTSVKRFEARTLSFSTAGPSNGPNRSASTSKKIRKHRSPLRTGKRAFSPSSTRLVHGFGDEHEPETRHVNKKFRITSNEAPKKFLKHTEEDTADNDFSFASDMPVSGQQNDQYDVAQETEGTQMDCEGEDAETDVPYDSVSRSDPAECCNQISDVSLSPENYRTADDDVLVEGCSVAVEDPNSSEQLAHGHESNSAANNEMDEWQMDPTSTKESSPCLTSNRDMGPGGHQDNSSITSNGEEDFNEEHGLPLGRGSLDSPISTASTMALPAALKDSRTNEEEPGPSTGRTVEEQTTGCLNQETNSIPMAREGELPSEKPFRCSCQENIARESRQSPVARPMLNSTGKQVPQLHIGSRASSSFSTYQRTSAKPNPCFDPHDHLLAAKVPAESAISFPYSTDCISPSFQTQLPSPSNPVLRLMGKDLMVMNSEESVHPQAPSSDYILRGNYPAPVGFMPPNYQHLSNSAFINMPPTTASHQIPLPSVQASGFVAPPLRGGSVMQSDHHSQQKPYRNIMPAMHRPTYMMKEVIVINDSPERRSEPQGSMLFPPAPPPPLPVVPNNMPPRPFYCFPPQSPVLPRERGAVGSMLVYANVGSMVGVNSSSQGSQTEVASPYMPNPFFVQSRAGYMNPPVYYSQNLG